MNPNQEMNQQINRGQPAHIGPMHADPLPIIQTHPPKRSMRSMIGTILAIIIMIAMAAALAYFFWPKNKSAPATIESDHNRAVESAQALPARTILEDVTDWKILCVDYKK